jgi:hypothetical protein
MIQATDSQTQAYLDTLLSRKGQIVTVKTQRPVKMKKGQPAVMKASEFQCRVGVNYDNIKAVQEKRESGELPKENAGLPWGEWALFPYVIAHKGEYYVRCTMLHNGFRKAPVYTIEGVEVDKEAVKAMALASEFREGDDNDVFNIKLSSILEVK